jgi:hypothetical protein
MLYRISLVFCSVLRRLVIFTHPSEMGHRLRDHGCSLEKR